MEPFSITCTTCKSRLKVKSASAIGQVVACPKCGGMVLVKPPEEGPPPEVANAATKPVEPQAAKARENSKDFDDVQAVLAGTAVAPPAAIPASASPPAEEPATAAAPSEEHPPPRPPARYGLWLAASILAGVILAVGVVVVSGWLLSDGRVAAIPAADEPTALPDRAPTAPAIKPAAAPGAKSPPNTAPPKTPQLASDADTKTTPKAKSPPAKTPPAKQAPQPEGDPLGIAVPQEPPAKVAAKAKGNSGQPALGDDPLEKFSAVLGSAANPLPETKTTAPPDRPAPADGADEPPARPSLPRPEPRTINIAARLADPLPGIEADGVPLADFLEAMSGLSTIPMTLRTEGLGLVKVSPASPVALKAAQTTVGEALEAGLRPLGLQYSIADDQLLIALAEPEGGKLQEYPVDDLTGGSDEQTEQLADWTTALVDPDAWSEEREGGTRIEVGPQVFTIQAANRTHGKLLFYFEKLRLARRLPLRSTHDRSYFNLQTRTAQAQEPLSTRISLNFSRPTLLVRILDRLEASAGATILVDWRALATLGWNPDALATLTVEDQPLATALDALLAPMDLSWRVIDARTVEVTSPAAIAQQPELEFHAAGDLAADGDAANALLARLQKALAAPVEAAPPGEEPPPAVLRFDPVSRHVLALLTQPQQRQVARLLAQWNAEAKAAAR